MAISTQMYEVDIADVEYLRHGEAPLLARLFKPQGSGPFPIMLELHGGAWVRGTRENGNAANEALAKTGVIVAALDFRTQAPYPASLADIHYAVRWAKTQAASWKGKPDRIGAMGTSSGAHQAMLLGMRQIHAGYGPTGMRRPAWGSGWHSGLRDYDLSRDRSAGSLSLCQRPAVRLHTSRGRGRAVAAHA